MTTCTLHVVGTPRPQPRARFVGRGKTMRVVSTANKHAKAWRAATMAEARRWIASGGETYSGAVALDVAFYFGTADIARIGQPHTSRPDADNLVKLLMDALESAGLAKGDAKVARLTVSKTWTTHAGMVATIGSVEESAPADDEGTGAVELGVAA